MNAAHPWRSERHLDQKLVERLVGEQLPELTGLPVRYLDEGWDFHVYEIGGRWILRFPKREQVLPWFAREQRILARVADGLPLPVPRYTLFGEACAVFPFRFAGYEKLEGQIALLAEPAAAVVPGMTAQLGELLAVLHAVEGEELAALELPADFDRDWPAKRLVKVEEQLERCREALGRALYGRMREYVLCGAPRAPAGARVCLTHDDLLPGHVLVSDDVARIIGVIDWSDATTGDPASDFAGILRLLGAAALDEALESYPHPTDEHLPARAFLAATASGLSDIRYGVDGARPEYVESGLLTLRRLFPDG